MVVEETENAQEEMQGDEGGEISFHALKGGPTGKIIKVKGLAGKRRLTVLIDGGSTHSFLNEATARDLKCKLTATTPLSVTVANGNKMHSHYKCADFKWLMQGQEFIAHLRILELG